MRYNYRGGTILKVYEFGNKENPSIMLLPGTCCHWKRYGICKARKRI